MTKADLTWIGNVIERTRDAFLEDKTYGNLTFEQELAFNDLFHCHQYVQELIDIEDEAERKSTKAMTGFYERCVKSRKQAKIKNRCKDCLCLAEDEEYGILICSGLSDSIYNVDDIDCPAHQEE